MVGVWCLMGKVRYGLRLINQLGPGKISALGKKPHQGRKEREKRGKILGRKLRRLLGKAEQSRPRVDMFQVAHLPEYYEYIYHSTMSVEYILSFWVEGVQSGKLDH